MAVTIGTRPAPPFVYLPRRSLRADGDTRAADHDRDGIGAEEVGRRELFEDHEGSTLRRIEARIDCRALHEHGKGVRHVGRGLKLDARRGRRETRARRGIRLADEYKE